MQSVIIVIHLMIVAVLIATVLLQKSEGGGLGMGGGAGFMSSRGTANLLTRTTAILAVGFFAAAAGGWRDSGGAPHPRRHSGFAEEVRSAAESGRTVRPAGAAVAIKRGGHAGPHLASCMSRPHQCADNTPDFTSPTAAENVRCGTRFVLANRVGSLKG